MTGESNTLKKADSFIDGHDFPLPGKPVGSPTTLKWPESVGDLTSVELAKHMTWWSGWASNVRYALARVETDETAFSAERKVRVQYGLSQLAVSKKTVTERKAEVEQDIEIQKLDLKILETKAKARLLKALLDGYSEKYATVSREVSRREKEAYEARR